MFQVTQCVTVATTYKLKVAHGGWYYQAYHACPRASKEDNRPFVCSSGHSTETEIYRLLSV